jgi:hypothetical protein
VRAELDPEETRENVSSALGRVAAIAMQIARELEAEYSQYSARLDLRSLSLIIDTNAGPRGLGQIGSGADWIVYHLAVVLALQQFFIENGRPVPRFLVLDQPSQVYSAESDEATALDDEDREALARYFRVIVDRINASGPGFQVLVLDHADLQEDWSRQL